MVDDRARQEIAGLAERAAAGDAAAFETLVERTHGTVYRLALRIVGTGADAEDVVQETYVRAWQGLGEIRDRGAAFAWICSVARNTALGRRRQRLRRGTESLDAPVGDGAHPILENLPAADASPEERMGSSQLRAAVHAALGALKEKHRLILSLREIDGMSYEEIAVALGCPVGTVESRLHRARMALAKKMKALAKEALP